MGSFRTVSELSQGSDEFTHAKQVLRLLKVIDRDPTE